MGGVGSIPTGLPAGGVVFTHTDFDTGGMWSAAQPTRVTAQSPGIYLVTGDAVFADTSGTGVRGLSITLSSEESWGVRARRRGSGWPADRHFKHGGVCNLTLATTWSSK
jgi:hypothetical protein